MTADAVLEAVHREEWGRIVARLTREGGDLALAEDAAAEAFAAALPRWRSEGTPDSPRAWLLATARHKLADALRRAARRRPLTDDLARTPDDPEWIGDERLRLFLTCCHPALSLESQVALTLRLLAGLDVPRIARAFLSDEATMGQRLSRAKRKIRDAVIPFAVPGPAELPERLEGAMGTIYLVFSEGYAASHRPERAALCEEAISLGRALREVAPSAEADGLLALMLLHHSRRRARLSPEGEIVLLEDQDRALWDAAAIREAVPLVALGPEPGPYAVQAAIAAAHLRPGGADWGAVVGLYDLLLARRPSPVAALNRAVAVSFASGPASALPLLDALEGELSDHALYWSARSEIRRRAGVPGAVEDARRALALTEDPAERRLLERRAREG